MEIIFDLCLFDLHLLFQECSWGIKQGFGVFWPFGMGSIDGLCLIL
jgi:hypothetical protein